MKEPCRSVGFCFGFSGGKESLSRSDAGCLPKSNEEIRLHSLRIGGGPRANLSLYLRFTVLDFFEIRWRPPILCLLAVIVQYYGLRDLTRAAASANWPKAPGKIASSQTVEHQRYRPSIAYTYIVEGKAYNGGTYRFGDTSYWKRKKAEAAVCAYTPGTAVLVSFNPSNPQTSVLEPGITADAWSPLEWTLPTFFVAAWLVKRDLKRVRARRLMQAKRPKPLK
jgi:Protein of unknown function (DUF3592)